MKTTKNSPYSNWIGFLIVLVALVIWSAQFFHELKTAIDNTALYTIGGVGLVVWLGFSDKAFKAFLQWFAGKKKD